MRPYCCNDDGMGKGRSGARAAGYAFRCSEAELDQLHAEAAELHTTLQALIEHRLLGRPLQTARQRRLAARQNEQELPLTG